MSKVIVMIEPTNGLSLPDLGHLKQGEHELDLTDEQIKLFNSDDADGVTVKQLAAKQPVVDKPEGPALNAEILDALSKLDATDTSLWTKTEGVPQTAALSSVLGYNVTAAERDAALAG